MTHRPQLPAAPARFALCALSALCALALAVVLALPAPAQAFTFRMSLSSRVEVAGGSAAGHRRQRRMIHRVASRSTAGRAPGSASAAPAEEGRTLIEAGFENGLENWNIAGVGEVVPTVVSGDARSGSHAARVVLEGSQERSELILGGDGGESIDGMARFEEGDEYWYGFSFNIQSMVYGGPGAHNLIMQFKSDGTGSPNFGLQLWDYEGDEGQYAGNSRGLWSHSDAMGGDRFLAPVSEHEWHDVAIHFKASSQNAGFYEVFLDGRLIDARSGVSMIVPGHEYGYIKDGLYRNGQTIPGHSEILLDAAKLGTTQASVSPG